MKSFDSLWKELETRQENPSGDSRTTELLAAGVHAIGKKIVEEAAEVWMAAEHQSSRELAEELAQLLYHAQVIALARGLKLSDIEEYL